MLVKGDGAEWICQGAAQVFPPHVLQLDRWHLLDRLAQFAGSQARLWKRLRTWVLQGPVSALVRSLRQWGGADARPLLTHGTGALEKNIEVLIGRRFKRWGRRWTRRGAHHLLKLRRWIAPCGTTWFEALNARPAQLTNA